MAPSLCDPMTMSHTTLPGFAAQPARAAFTEPWTCQPSLPGNIGNSQQLPPFKDEQCKISLHSRPSTSNAARHLNRAFLLSQHFHCQTRQWPRQGGSTDPRSCQTDTPSLALRISSPKDIPLWFRSSDLRLRKAASVSPTWCFTH